MRSSRAQARSPSAAGCKRRKPGASGSRTRKKQKRLDAICDRPETPAAIASPYRAASGEATTEAEDGALIRRSSRVRRAPAVLDSSPVPSHRKKGNRGKRSAQASGGKRSRRKRHDVESVDSKVKREIKFEDQTDVPVDVGDFSEEDTSDWGSRLRSRVRRGQRGSISAAGKRTLSYGQLHEVLLEDKGLTKPKEQVMVSNVDSLGLETNRKERRKRKRKRKKRKLKEGDGAPLLQNDKKAEASRNSTLVEEVVGLLPSSDSDGKSDVAGDEVRTAAEASRSDERKDMNEKSFRECKDETTYEDGLLQDENKTTVRGGMLENESVISEKALSAGNNRINRKEASKSKISFRGDIPDDRKVMAEKALSSVRHEISHRKPTLLAESDVALSGDMLEDGDVASENPFSGSHSVVETLKSLLEHGNKNSVKETLQKDKDKTTDKPSLEEDGRILADSASANREGEVAVNLVLDENCDHNMDLVATDRAYAEQEEKCTDEKGGNVIRDNMVNILCRLENGLIDQDMGTQMDKIERRAPESNNIMKQENSMHVRHVDVFDRPRVKEGRRCGLCGGGSDGKPPKKLILESPDSDNEPYSGSPSSEEPNYDLWDGFGDEPEWLGRLLGPVRDRVGIARVWVHQQCAVWSPEVYFAGLGRLKSVGAALCRGRVLKCSRCGRPGATIGCRVDRCPKTYHLPCARAENCIFDHRKFLIACIDHRHIFQPPGNGYSKQIKKMKTRKMRSDMRKLSNEAVRKDLEDEEKWLENCGEDEEFLKREGKRLHRDLLRVTPVYIGGSSSEKEKMYQGWESVAGLQDVVQCMKEVIILPLLYPELFNSLGLTPPRGVLLHGYPGTGKTLVVRALIGECSRGDKRIAYFARKGADCLGKYVGDAERQLRLLFQVAEKCQPSIIFFDEIDGLAPCRSKRQDQTHNSVVSTLLSLLDGLKSRGSVVVIGATNRPDAVDPALRRPGRFDREIYFPLPSAKDRSAILSLQTKNWPKPLYEPVLSWIANQTAGYAGADLQALCTQAAMIALKRNCPLHEMLASAEKGSSCSRQPSLPSFTVEERDWLAALACAPPPCSRREAGMAANGVITAPLPAHLISCLLQPLAFILVSFYLEERIWMPPALFKASKSTSDVISSALEQMKLPITSWKFHLPQLTEKTDIVREIERNLSCCGLLDSTMSAFGSFCTLDNDNGDKYGKFCDQRLQHPHSCTHSFKSPNASVGLEKASGFRVFIAGTPRCGQQHLAACLLHQFLGHIEILKVNLATISQEGRGDIIHGITQILLKCASVGQCVLYMPRLDLWAVCEMDQQDSEDVTSHKTYKSSQTGGLDNAVKRSSRAWDSFVEQLNSMRGSSSLIVLATCDMAAHELPVRIRDFFMTSVLKNTDSSSSEHTIPRFFVQLDASFRCPLVISSSVAKVSHDVVQQYVQLIHQRSHADNMHEELKVCDTTEVIDKKKAAAVAKNEAAVKVCTTADSVRISPDCGASLMDDHARGLVNDSKREKLISKINQEGAVPLQSSQDSLSRVPSKKITKGNSMFMIATLGYQILQYPQFAELCWVTSKLKEGPSADVNGPWRVWPFNSCIIDAKNSIEKATSPFNISSGKDKEISGVVRGLVAVGLLAYRGAYTSVREVSFEVRNVLELLVRLISEKIQNGRDRYLFVRLLSQVAYLDDMVNSWAYTYQSLQIDSRSQVSGSNRRHVILGKMDENNNANSFKLLEDDASVPNSCDQTYNAIPESMQRKGHESHLAQNGENETGRSEVPGPCSFPCARGLEVPKRQNSLPMAESIPFVANLHNVSRAVPPTCGCRDASEQCSCLGDANSSNSDRLSDKQIGDTEFGLKTNGNALSSSNLLCLYDVCIDCLQSLYVLIQEILTHCLESSGNSLTVDDVHDIVISCSLNLVATIRNFFSQSCTKSEEHCSRDHGSLTKGYVFQDTDGIKLKKNSPRPRQFEHLKFLPSKCSQHQRNGKTCLTRENAYNNSSATPELKLLFRDGILLPSNPLEDVVLHCNFEKLSIQAVIEIISSAKQPYA